MPGSIEINTINHDAQAPRPETGSGQIPTAFLANSFTPWRNCHAQWAGPKGQQGRRLKLR